MFLFLTCVFYGEGFLSPRPNPKLEDHPLSAVHGCLFNLFTATLYYIYIYIYRILLLNNFISLDCVINYSKLVCVYNLPQVKVARLIHCLMSIVRLVAAITIRSISDGDNNTATIRLEVSGVIILPRGHYTNK
jgi:hypothetical protein